MIRGLRHRTDGAPALSFGAILGANAFATQVSGIVGLSGFLNQVGVPELLIVWLIDDVSILAISSIQAFLVDRFNRLALVRWASVAFGLALLAVRLLPLFGVPAWLTYSLLYGVSEQQFLFFPLIFWVLAEDGIAQGQRPRAFPVIGSWGLGGKLLGISLSGSAPVLLHHLGVDPINILYADAAMYGVIWLVIEVRLKALRIRRTAAAHASAHEVLNEGIDFIRSVPAFRFLTLAMVAVMAAGVVLEFRFYGVSEATFPSTDSYQAFFSVYRFGFVLLSLLLETFAVRRLLARIGLKNSFLILPVMATAGALAVAIQPNLLAAALGGLVFLRLPHSTIDEIARKQFQGLVPEERRGRVSLLMDGYLYATGDILGCAACGAGVLLMAAFHNPSLAYVYLGFGVAATVAAVAAALALRATYDASLLNWRLKRRARASELLGRLL